MPVLSTSFSPVNLSYVAALRGVRPRKTTEPFVYAQIGSFSPDSLLCLAASNPEGRFFGILPTAQAAQEAGMQAGLRQVWNVSFGAQTSLLPAQLHYLFCDAGDAVPSQAERESLFNLAQEKLGPCGIFAYRYRAYANSDEPLLFLISEYAPELSAAQAEEFLSELKGLGLLYFKDHPISLAALDKAIADKAPNGFFETCLKGASVSSGAFETMAGLLPRGFAAAGDADIGANYMELSAPAAAHATLEKCRTHLLYEPIKDFALSRAFRNDVWVKLPVDQTARKPDLFGSFTFGITMPKDRVPTKISGAGCEIDLSTPLFQNLIQLMCLLPTGIGDFLLHPLGRDFEPDDVLSAIQILVAAKIAQPMRGRYEGQTLGKTESPKWTTPFNAYLNEAEIAEDPVSFASPIVGGVVYLSAREALVIQALGRVGLSNLSGSLQPTLKALAAKNPALASLITEAATPTDEVVHNLVTDVLNRDMVRWYAYGLLAA